jgi:hypothetical protein
MANLNLLRIALDNLELQVLDAFRHIDAVEGLKTQFNHSIKSLNPKVRWLPGYTCLVYALGFAGDATYSAAIKRVDPKEVFAGKEFFDWLLANKHLVKIEAGSESAGDFIVYFNSHNEFKHIGILTDKKRVESKWGELGLYDHEIFDVPENYGDEIKFFEPIKYDVAIAAFKQFVAETA